MKTISIYKRILIFIFSSLILFILFSLRNLDPILYPTLYAEDAIWTSKVIDLGFWDTAFNTRLFPIVGFVIFYKISLLLLDLVSEGNLFYLPIVYFILSNAFFSLCVLAAFNAFKGIFSRVSLSCLIMAMIMMPVGTDGNEIFGRVLNLGFIFPVLQVILLLPLLKEKRSVIYAVAAFTISLVSCLTFPVGIGIQCAFAVICLYIGCRLHISVYYKLMAVSIITVVVSLFLLSGNAIRDNGGADFLVKGSAFVEFSLARALLYPFVFSFYNHLNDVVTILIVIVFLCVCFKPFKNNVVKIINNIDRESACVLFVWASFGIYYLSIVIMRKGLSSCFVNYTLTYPDRYFLGLNILFVMAMLMLIDKTKFNKVFLVLLIIPMFLSIGNIFEINKPATKVSASPMWTEEYCRYLLEQRQSNGLYASVPPEGWIFHSTSYNLNQKQRENFIGRCHYSYLYKIPLLGALQPPLFARRALTFDMERLPSMATVSSHNVSIIPRHNGFSVKAVGDDPYFVLSLNDNNQHTSRLSIPLVITSSSSVQFKVYYQFKSNPSFSEEDSILFNVSEGTSSLYLNASKYISTNQIRIDLPDHNDDVFIFDGISATMPK